MGLGSEAAGGEAGLGHGGGWAVVGRQGRGGRRGGIGEEMQGTVERRGAAVRLRVVITESDSTFFILPRMEWKGGKCTREHSAKKEDPSKELFQKLPFFFYLFRFRSLFGPDEAQNDHRFLTGSIQKPSLHI